MEEPGILKGFLKDNSAVDENEVMVYRTESSGAIVNDSHHR